MNISLKIGDQSGTSFSRSELKANKLYLALSNRGIAQTDRVYFLVDGKLVFSTSSKLLGSLNTDTTRYVEAPIGTEVTLKQILDYGTVTGS